MTVLAIDAGNTRIKWGVYARDGWSAAGWVPTADAAALADALASVGAPDCIVGSNVAGDAVRAGIEAALERFALPVQWLRASRSACGVVSGYADAAQLGTDRWAALIGARRRYAAACVVVNAGTTLTVDALTAEGVFLGGCIVPGLALMQETLARNTAQLPASPGRFLYFPDNTADAIMSGAINALAGAVDRVVGYMQQTTGTEPLVLLSGGAAEALQPHLAGRVERVDHLVLEGLVEVGIQERQETQP